MGKCMPKYQNIPNYNKIYKITTKLPQNIQNYQKYTQWTYIKYTKQPLKYQMTDKYTIVFRSKKNSRVFQNGDFWYAIWQPWRERTSILYNCCLSYCEIFLQNHKPFQIFPTANQSIKYEK
jgi:hypothetical protein